MHFPFLSVFTTLLASAVIALPSHHDRSPHARGLKTSFSLPAAYSPAKRIKKRVPVDMPPVIIPPKPKKEQSEIEFQPAFMTVTMGVGTPPQDQTVTFDTGTGNIWVFGGDQNQGLFHPASSSSFHNVTTAFQSNPGSYKGYYAQDTISLGAVSLKDAWFGVADSSASTGQGGAMGMAPPAADKNAYGTPPQGTLPPFTSTLTETLVHPYVGLNIYAGVPGTVDFGYIDETKYTGTLNYVDADTSGAAWQMDQVYFSINGVKTTASSGLPVVLDTGGQTISFDKDIVTEYYSKIPGAKDVSGGNQTDYRVPCNTTLPDLNIGFNEFQWNTVANIFGNELMNYNSQDEECTCETYFAARGGHNFGPMFWMSNFVVLDFTQGKSRVGFASKATTLPVPKPSSMCTAPQVQPSMQQQVPPMPQQSKPLSSSQPSTTAPGVFWSGGGSCGTALASGSGTAAASGCGTAALGTGTVGANGAAQMLNGYTGIPSSIGLPEMTPIPAKHR